jgi:predicted DNA-binding WGR domain protein
MIKLYRNDGEMLHYWEAWNTNNEITIHWGAVGQEGDTREITLPPGNDVSSVIEAEAAQPRAEGYQEIEGDRLQRVTIQYPILEMGTTADLEKRYEVETLMNNRLGWTGLGHCDGGDIGSGTMNIFCFVVDPDKAAQIIAEELNENDLLTDAKIILVSEEDEERLLFPIASLNRTQ